MPDPNNHTFLSICSTKDHIKQFRFVIFEVSSQGITAQISNLYHAGKLTVNEQRGLNNMIDLCPKRTIFMKFFHQ